jgi:hypothetical protein
VTDAPLHIPRAACAIARPAGSAWGSPSSSALSAWTRQKPAPGRGAPKSAPLGEKAKARLQQLVSTGSVYLDEVPCSCPPETLRTKNCNHGRLCARLTDRRRRGRPPDRGGARTAPCLRGDAVPEAGGVVPITRTILWRPHDLWCWRDKRRIVWASIAKLDASWQEDAPMYVPARRRRLLRPLAARPEPARPGDHAGGRVAPARHPRAVDRLGPVALARRGDRPRQGTALTCDLPPARGPQ